MRNIVDGTSKKRILQSSYGVKTTCGSDGFSLVEAWHEDGEFAGVFVGGAELVSHESSSVGGRDRPDHETRVSPHFREAEFRCLSVGQRILGVVARGAIGVEVHHVVVA